MPFTTPVPLQTMPFSIQHQDQILAIGSCFAQNIGIQLQYYKFNSLLNPFGILYNPASIYTCLSSLLSDYEFSDQDIFQHQGIWSSYFHHSSFSSLHQKEMLRQLNQSAKKAQQFLRTSNRLIVTLGTAYAYHHEAWNGIVANCHKLPQSTFIKKRLTVSEIVALFAPLFQQLKQAQVNLEILLTVSPIRHIKDGIIENQRSKAVLLLATEQLTQQLDFVHYFPAYEYMMDELRDYRFYAKDLVHPSEMAIEFIWEKFQDTFFDDTTRQLNLRIRKIKQAAAHCPLQPNSTEHQQFVVKQLEAIAALEQSYDFLDFSVDKNQFSKQLFQLQKN